MPDTQAATELKLFIDNDGDLYRQMTTSILKNLTAKKARGVYRHDLAVKLFGYLTEAGAKKYAQEFGSGPWHKMFDVSTRKFAAEELTRDFEDVYASGGYDSLLPKKYQKPAKVGPSRHARKKSTAPRGVAARWKAVEDRRTEFGVFLRNVTDRQLQAIYAKENNAGRDEYAALAVDEAKRRGIDLDPAGGGGRYDHSRRKQIAREILQVVPSYRGR